MLSLRLITGLLAALLAATSALPARASQGRLAQVQQEIEQQVKALLGDQLAAGEYLVYAVVRGGAEAPAAPEAGAALPYGAVRVAPGLLRDILVAKYGKDGFDDLEIAVTVTLDQRIPDSKRQLLADALMQRFGFDNAKRKLDVRTAELVSTPIGEAERFRLEKARLESEQARLRLETEQVRLEVKRKDLELTQLKTATPTPAAATPAAATPAATPDAEGQVPQPATNTMQLSPTISIFKDFQLTAMALVLGFIIIVAILVGGSFFVKGLSPISRAIESIGSSIETAAKSTGGGSTQVTTVAAGGSEGGDGAGSGRGDGSAATTTVAATPVSEAFLRDQEAFVKEVQAKVDILSREKNFSFYRIFSEMIESRVKLPLAASILVSLDRETARQIVSDLSAEQLASLRGFLNAEGGLMKAKELKLQALSEFYGQIAMAEYQGSPLMELRDLSWLTRKSTPELARFLTELSDDERPVFLACLSPERVRRILEVPMEDDMRAMVLRAVAQIPRVTEDLIKPTIETIAQRAAHPAPADHVSRPAVDGAKYIAAVASELPRADQTALFDAIKDDKALIEDVRQHYIPFAFVRQLPKELLLEIFGDRADQQIATILFDAAPEVRDAVVGCLQEIRAESVKDEIKVLDEDKFYKKRNQKASARMQREISRYLQTLYAEGLITFDKPAEERTNGGAYAGDNAA